MGLYFLVTFPPVSLYLQFFTSEEQVLAVEKSIIVFNSCGDNLGEYTRLPKKEVLTFLHRLVNVNTIKPQSRHLSSISKWDTAWSHIHVLFIIGLAGDGC